VSVREAAVDLLGCHIGQDAELAASYLDMLIQSSRDAGTSVRKRALTILWESCIRCNLSFHPLCWCRYKSSVCKPDNPWHVLWHLTALAVPSS
jgi:hypothetical protein